MRKHLTDAVVRRLPPPDRGNKITKDDSATGFGARITAAGHRAFILDYTTKAGRERRYTIGDFPGWSTVAARAEARRLRQEIEQGVDPLADIQDARAAPTVIELCGRFETEHVSRKRASTARDYSRMLRRICEHFGPHMKVTEVTHADCDSLHRKISKTSPYSANRYAAVLSKLFATAVRWGMRETNPAKGIERNLEHHRRRYLVNGELERLTTALAEHPDKQTADIIRILLLTGARRGEVLAMRWADVDLAEGVWSKAPSSTKQKQHHQIPLAAPARQLLSGLWNEQSRNHSRSEFVFPGIGGTSHVVEIKKSWAALCAAAGIEGLRVHDLRHSFASELVSSGASLPMIGSLLGHANPVTTSRYSHLYRDPQRDAVEKVGARIAGTPAVEPPVALPSPRRGR